MDREKKWCTVKFKYEKLGTFCFVCGVMGHAENKCEIRFAMDHDDGNREWTAEIRADSRRQGGRFTSKWLKEERGGGAEQEGGGAAGLRQNPVDSPNSGPASADVSSGLETNFQNGPNINHAAIISRQTHSLANYNIQTPQAFTLTQNIGNLSPSHTPIIGQSIPSPIPIVPAFNSPHTDSQTVPLSSILSQDNHLNPISKFKSPMILTQPITENNNSPSLTHQLLTFTSQSNNLDPHAVNQKPTRHTRAHHRPAAFNRNPTHIFDPTQNRTRPEKKPKTAIPKNPTHSQTGPAATPENMDDAELQIEKKRRREDDSSTNNETSHNLVHFLAAGPGSQAGRDQ
jgi:hypothetical protein